MEVDMTGLLTTADVLARMRAGQHLQRDSACGASYWYLQNGPDGIAQAVPTRSALAAIACLRKRGNLVSSICLAVATYRDNRAG
jgi:hypothetical protein